MTIKKQSRILVIFFLFFLLVAFLNTVQSTSVETATSEPFRILLDVNSQLRFQEPDNAYVTVQALGTLLNGSSCTLSMSNTNGILTFYLNQATSIRTTFNVTGVKINDSEIGSGNTTALSTGTNIIEWYYFPEYFSPQFPLMMGLIGFGLMFLSPIMMIRKLKEQEYARILMPWFMMFVAGFCFIIGWIYQ